MTHDPDFQQKRVSVVLATYNGDRHLEEQLQSIATQSLLPSELIAADDGSTDDTWSILTRFAASAPFPVRLFRNTQTKGYIENFISSSGYAQGDLIAFADQDDVWFSDKLKLLADCFSNPAVMLAYHNARVVNKDLQGTSLLYDEEKHRSALSVKPMHPWHHSFGLTQMFRRELLKYGNLWPASWDHNHDQKMAHDQWFIFLAQLTGKVEFISEALVYYRQHENNVVGATQSRSIAERLREYVYHTGDWERRALRAANARAEAARVIGVDAPHMLANHISTIEKSYRVLARNLTARRLLYVGKDRKIKIYVLISLVIKGAYSVKNIWKFNALSIFRDIAFCFRS